MSAGVLAIGGAHARTQVLLTVAVLLLVVLHGIAVRGPRAVPFVSVALLAVALSLVQLIPFPAAFVRLVSPHAYELRSEVTGAAPSFMPLSLDLPATLLEICKGLMYTGVLLVVGRCAARDKRARPLLVSLSLLGVLLALIGITQRAIHTDLILGVYRVQSLPGSMVFGTFVNGNHASSILVLAALVSIGLAFEANGTGRLLWVAAGAVSVTALLFFTQSRGGLVAFLVGGSLLIPVLLARIHGRWRGLTLAVVIIVAASLGVVALADGMHGRFSRGGTSQLWENQKTRGWTAAWHLVVDFPWTGVGRGAFEAPAAAYRTDGEGVRLVYPENLPLQLLTEWGILATLAVAVTFAIAVARLMRRLVLRQEPAVLAATCAVVAVLLHDLVDFGLEMPGVALPTVVALGVVVGRAYGGRNANAAVKFPRLPVAVVAAVASVWIGAIAGGVWAADRNLTADGARARDAITLKSPVATAVVDQALARHPADYYLELMAAIQQMRTGASGGASRVLHHLNRALRLNPTSGETHVLTARWLAKMGYRPQAALEFRLGREHGVVVEFDEIFAAVGAYAVNAVPQQSDVLLSLSQHLSVRGHPDAADAAARRAVDRAENPDGALTNVIDLATATREHPRMVSAAAYVLAAKPGPQAVAAAAKALFQAGEKAAALKALDEALRRIPDDPAIVLAAARLRVEFGDPRGARELLAKSADEDRNFHLADMVEVQQLLAQIADQLGDADAAVLARARGRMFSRRLSESQQAIGLLSGTEARPR